MKRVNGLNDIAEPVIAITVDDHVLSVPAGISAAAALAYAQESLVASGCARLSVRGEPRAPVCGMGICHECRVMIDGRRRLACQTSCREGMRIDTGLGSVDNEGGQP